MLARRHLVGLAALAALMPASARAAFPGRDGPILATVNSDDGCGTTLSGDVLLGDEGHWRTLGAAALRAALSADGRRLALDDDDGITILDRRTGRRRAVEQTSEGYEVHDPAWSADGRRLAFDDTAGNIWVARADGSDARRLFTAVAVPEGVTDAFSSRAFQPAWSVRGDLAFAEFAGPRATLVRTPAGRLRPTPLASTTGHSLGGPDWSPDGRRVAFAMAQGVAVVRRDGRGLRRLTPTLQRWADPAWSPDGRALVAARDDELVRMAADGTHRRIIDRTRRFDWFSEPEWLTASVRVPARGRSARAADCG